MSDFARRVKLRTLIELDGELIDEQGGNPSVDDHGTEHAHDAIWPTYADIEEVAQIAALEAEDTAKPIAATAIVRKDAVAEIAPPDVEVLLAAFHTPEEDQ